MKYFIVLLLFTASVTASERDNYLRNGEEVTSHRDADIFSIVPKSTSGTVDRKDEYNQPETVGHKPDPFSIKQDERRYEVESKGVCWQVKCD